MTRRLRSAAAAKPPPSSSPSSLPASLPAPTAVPGSTEHRAALDVELFAQGARALAQARETRPKNTNKSYDPKQKEWQEFCKDKGFEDGELVYENKLVWFLNDRVLTRDVRVSRHKRENRTMLDGTPIKQTLGMPAVKSYVAAIVDLWSFQQSKGTNRYPNPRGEALNGLLRARARGEHKRRRLEFADRAAGTMQDGYDEAKMIAAMRFCWQGGKRPHKLSTEPFLRTALDFLLGHNMLLRSESRLAAELPDFFTIPLPNEGPTPCPAMVMIMDNGKTNQLGRLEYGAVMRHRNPLLCTMGHTAFYLFYRWNIADEAPPYFRQRQQWYDIHLLKGAHADKQMAYDTQLDWINQMFAGAGVKSLKKTHLPRGQGATHAELHGASEGQIRRAGRWNNDAMTGCYLTHLPRKFIRAMAGFNPSAQGNFYLPRAKVMPPRSLERTLWPWVDEWLEWFEWHTDNEAAAAAAAAAEQEVVVEEDARDLAGQGFLRLLCQLRIILLQDSVIMRHEFPGHPIWADPIFARDDYAAFAKDVELSLLDVEEPEEVRIRKTLPAIAERLSVLHMGLARDINEWGSDSKARLDSIELRLGDLLEGRVSLTLHSSAHATPLGHATPAGSFRSALASPSPPILAPPPPPSLSHTPVAVAAVVAAPQPPQYMLSRTITTVPELWMEWTLGLPGGQPVQGLEDQYGPRWRQKHSEQVLYGRRKVIIDEIRRRQAGGISTGAAVEEVELMRQRGRLSLYSLYSLLQRGKKVAAPQRGLIA